MTVASNEPPLAPWDDRPAPTPASMPKEETLSLFSEDELPTIQEPPLPVPLVEPEPVAEPEPPQPVREQEPEEPQFSPTPPASAAPEPPALDRELWPRLISEVREKKPLLSSWVEAGALIGIENGVCTLAFPEGSSSSFSMESLEKPAPRRFLEETLARLTGQPITLKLELRPGLVVTPVNLPEKAPQIAADPMAEFKNDPLIRHALDLFKAEIQVG